MKWYYEKEGISQGPLPEDEIIALVLKKEVVASTLIWHSGLEDWGMVNDLKPEWLKQTAAPPAAAPSPAPAKQTMPKTEGPLPAAEAPSAPKLAKPKAGLEKSTEDTGKVGLLGRLFGFGKKKK